jgi:hypothetical protein
MDVRGYIDQNAAGFLDALTAGVPGGTTAEP